MIYDILDVDTCRDIGLQLLGIAVNCDGRTIVEKQRADMGHVVVQVSVIHQQCHLPGTMDNPKMRSRNCSGITRTFFLYELLVTKQPLSWLEKTSYSYSVLLAKNRGSVIQGVKPANLTISVQGDLLQVYQLTVQNPIGTLLAGVNVFQESSQAESNIFLRLWQTIYNYECL